MWEDKSKKVLVGGAKVRLIDADELIKDLNEQIPLAENVSIFNDIIESQPTAYDVDKVVEQLEDESEIYCREYGKEDELYLQGAIEIVKEGGLNDTSNN